LRPYYENNKVGGSGGGGGGGGGGAGSGGEKKDDGKQKEEKKPEEKEARFTRQDSRHPRESFAPPPRRGRRENVRVVAPTYERIGGKGKRRGKGRGKDTVHSMSEHEEEELDRSSVSSPPTSVSSAASDISIDSDISLGIDYGDREPIANETEEQFDIRQEKRRRAEWFCLYNCVGTDD
jgi:hypothetical protein